MAITKDKKKVILEKLTDILKHANSFVFMNFHGLRVKTEAQIRRTLREKGVSYYVAKKTLIKKALEGKSYRGTQPELMGEIALVYGEDAVAPAREINEFAKKNKETLSIVGGMFEGKYMDQSEMREIAAIPPLEVLYGHVVQLINSPIQGFVMALSEIAKKKETT